MSDSTRTKDGQSARWTVPAEVVRYVREAEAPGRAVIATDPDGTVIFWGVGAEALYGWTEREVVGRNITAVTPSDMSRAMAEQVMDVLRKGRTWSGEFLVQTRRGDRFLAQVEDVPVTDADGGLLGIVGISRRSPYSDVTPRKSGSITPRA